MRLSIDMGVSLGPIRGRGEEEEFDPASVFSSGEAGGWYDPSDLSTMFQDTAGSTPVTTAGQSVARINDKSGRGLHLTQATAANQPTYQVADGRPYLSFDGTNDCLFNTTPISGVNQSIAAAVSNVTGGANGAIWADVVSASDRVVLTDNAVAIIVGYYNGTAYTPKSGAANGSPHVDLAEIIKGTSTGLRVNSTAQSGTTNPSVLATVGVCLGATAPTGGIFFAGRCYGLMHVARALTSTERAGLETLFGSKMGITL